mmetsp:Transcript_3047/g.9305  ORF Transcript_3047/g.9305 Transcript_3047/m.9305 type:complete len:495 (-) Transcript_3047:986-2470(-)|eukprot:CAMPEP_0198735344 /NCGR_PEP_ID=MMETSP1475-20131203/58804_1 /TAXON_ID= ORGANISM="Unidentified sp., Strain CCMP1999" /NCGR_SAMPLE_ID=MMETSP1475 /ASSEMBLY_ACC=CAM_ASM_001111 /LENGTH=494 /DNA_ID=CAMNT_0044498993 /DNA_START=8 /DNA_END=1492 /DNA_ORIENTATION=-
MGTKWRGLLSRRVEKVLDGDVEIWASKEKDVASEAVVSKSVMHMRISDCGALEKTPMVAVLLSKRLSGSKVGDWKELDRIYVDDFEARNMHTFQALFYSNEEKLIRIELRRVSSSAEQSSKPTFLGAVETLLMHVRESQGEWLHLRLKETNLASGAPRPKVSVVFEQLKNLNHVVTLDIAVTVKKKRDWPFSSARPFYIVYRSEPDGTWNPLYRSEVLLRANERRQTMRFRPVDLNSGRLNDYNDSRPIRIEFLHYKMNGSAPRVLGHVETSVAALRQTTENSELQLNVRDITEGSLSGAMYLRESAVNSSMSFFTLDALFGDVEADGDADTVLLDVNCAVERTEAWPFNSSKLFFVVSQILQDRNSVIHRSEMVSKPNDDGLHKFELVTLKQKSLINLVAGGQEPVIKVEFFHFKTSGNHRLLGHVNTTLESLRQVPPQGMLLFHSNVIPEGSVRGRVSVEQAEVSAGRSYFSLHCQLGRTDVRRRLPTAGAH